MASGTTKELYLSPESWDGTPRDMTGFTYITVWCFSVPDTAWTIQCGIPENYVTQTGNVNNASGSAPTTTINALGRYVIAGNCWVQLSGGSGGTLFISGGS